MKLNRRVVVMVGLVLLIVLSASFLQAKGNKEAKIAKLEKQLTKSLGTNSNWKPVVFKDLKLGMPWNQVRKYFPGLRCNASKKYDFPRVPGKKLFGKIREYKFTFKYGRLQNATIVFGPRILDEKRFFVALHRVVQRKWGKLSADKIGRRIKVWSNADHDSVTMSFHKNHWEIKTTMPKRDTGDVHAASLTPEVIGAGLSKLLGASGNWKASALGKFYRGMTCEQVSKVYSAMKGHNPYKSWSFGTVTIKNHSLVHALKFSFQDGLLRNATLIFHRQLPKETFKVISLRAFEAKWGKVRPEKRNNDIITKYKSRTGSAQRTFSRDHWEIKFDFPKA
ncbi:MAG: hypothetical protein GY765_28915 [bacterium]|nr:hypothetical protein [bacterium]